MGEPRKGMAKIQPGLWSRTIARDFSERIDKTPGLTKDKVSKQTGIAGSRVTQLLRGDKSWYVEDVEKFCQVFNLKLPQYIASIQAQIDGNTRPFKVALPIHREPEGLPAHTDLDIATLLKWYEGRPHAHVDELDA